MDTQESTKDEDMEERGAKREASTSPHKDNPSKVIKTTEPSSRRQKQAKEEDTQVGPDDMPIWDLGGCGDCGCIQGPI